MGIREEEGGKERVRLSPEAAREVRYKIIRTMDLSCLPLEILILPFTNFEAARTPSPAGVVREKCLTLWN